MRRELIKIKKECRRRQSELNYTAEPRAREAMSLSNAHWCKLALGELVCLHKAKHAEFARHHAIWFGVEAAPYELQEQTGLALQYRFGQWAFLLIEIIWGAWIATKTINGSWIVSALLGLFLALAGAWAASLIASSSVCKGTDLQPAKKMDRIRQGLIYLGRLWLAALVTALTVVRISESAAGPWLFWISMTMLTVLSPLCSGLCGVAADVLAWSGRIHRTLRPIHETARELEMLRLESERDMAALAARGGPGRTAVVILLLLMGGGARAADFPVYVYADVSPSARTSDVSQLLKSFTRELAHYEGADALKVSLVPFYEDAFMAEPLIEINIAGSAAPACPTATNELVLLAASYAEAQRRQCDRIRQQAKSAADTSRSAEIAKLSAAVDRLAELRLPGKCTAVDALIKRAAREKPNGISLVISDMENTCSTHTFAESAPENQTFLVPVGSRRHSIEDGFDAIQARFSRSAPWIQVIEAYQIQIVVDAIAHRKGNLHQRP